jgi:uncharacterized protein (UPF0262 family)
MTPAKTPTARKRLVAVTLDEETIGRSNPDVEHERQVAIYDLLEQNFFAICDSYYQAIRTATPDKIEAIDMGRRGIHNDGSQILLDRLKGKVTVDIDTARRLFTLICVLHWKG